MANDRLGYETSFSNKEYITGVCGGGTLYTSTGDLFTFPFVSSPFLLNQIPAGTGTPGSAVEVPGTRVTYRPPRGTIRVIYRTQFQLSFSAGSNGNIILAAFQLNYKTSPTGATIEAAEFAYYGDALQTIVEFEHVFHNSSTWDTTWNTLGQIWLTVIPDTGNMTIHGSRNWDGGAPASPEFHRPRITVIAEGY